MAALDLRPVVDLVSSAASDGNMGIPTLPYLEETAKGVVHNAQRVDRQAAFHQKFGFVLTVIVIVDVVVGRHCGVQNIVAVDPAVADGQICRRQIAGVLILAHEHDAVVFLTHLNAAQVLQMGRVVQVLLHGPGGQPGHAQTLDGHGGVLIIHLYHFRRSQRVGMNFFHKAVSSFLYSRQGPGSQSWARRLTASRNIRNASPHSVSSIVRAVVSTTKP